MIDKNILKNKFKGEILFDEKMSNHTSYGVGGRVNAYIRPKNKPELIQIIKLFHKSNSEVYYLAQDLTFLYMTKISTAMLFPQQKQLNL